MRSAGAPLRRWGDGLGPYLAIAAVLTVFAGLAFLLVAVSPQDRMQWTGTSVIGHEQHGLVYYSWRGESYTLAVPGFGSKPRYAVVFDRSDPSNAERDSLATRIADIALVGGPLALATAALGWGLLRRRSMRAGARDPSFGRGLDPDFVQRQLEQLRRPPPPG